MYIFQYLNYFLYNVRIILWVSLLNHIRLFHPRTDFRLLQLPQCKLYIFYIKVISIEVTADGKPDLEEPLLSNKNENEKGEKVPRSVDLVKSLKHISTCIDEVLLFCLLFLFWEFNDIIVLFGFKNFWCRWNFCYLF